MGLKKSLKLQFQSKMLHRHFFEITEFRKANPEGWRNSKRRPLTNHCYFNAWLITLLHAFLDPPVNEIHSFLRSKFFVTEPHLSYQFLYCIKLQFLKAQFKTITFFTLS